MLSCGSGGEGGRRVAVTEEPDGETTPGPVSPEVLQARAPPGGAAAPAAPARDGDGTARIARRGRSRHREGAGHSRADGAPPRRPLGTRPCLHRSGRRTVAVATARGCRHTVVRASR